MNTRSLLPLILLPILLLTGCTTTPRYAGAGPQSAVMLIKVRKEKKPQRIVIELNDSAAPQTVANFKDLVNRHYYDGMRFHRLFPHQLVQTGDPKSRQGEHQQSNGKSSPCCLHLRGERGGPRAIRLAGARAKSHRRISTQD